MATTWAAPVTGDIGLPQSMLGPRSADARAKDAQKYLTILDEQRLLWEPMIDNLIMYVNHGRRSIQDKDLWPGQQTGMEVFADSAMLARNKLVDGMTGYLCGRNQPWFALGIPGRLNFPRTSGMRAWTGKRADSYPAVQRWLQDSQEVMYSAFNRSNFYDVVTEFISDGATCGTAHFLAEDDLSTATTVCTVPHFRECWIAVNCFGQVDTNYRVYKLTLRQLVQQFGLQTMERADIRFRQDYEKNMYEEREVLHAIYPRADYEPGKIGSRGKKWASDWIYRKGGKILPTSGDSDQNDVFMLSEGGYDSMPSISWRWRVNSDEVYGRGPAHDAWVSIALDNQMGRTNLITGQKAAEPPLVAWADQRGKIMRGPNGITFVEGNSRGNLQQAMPQLLASGIGNLPFSVEFQDRVKAVINEHFHADMFTLLTNLMQEHGTGRPVTSQISELQTEKAAVLGTRVGKLQSEFFDPLIARFFDIEARGGRIPEAPQILLDAEHRGVEVEYMGLLAKAQTRLEKVRSIQSGVALVEQITQFDPLAMHAIDTDQMVRESWDAVGAPISCLRDPRAIAQIRQMAEQQRKQQQAVENAPKIAKAASLMGKGADENSPMKTLLGGSPEPGEDR